MQLQRIIARFGCHWQLAASALFRPLSTGRQAASGTRRFTVHSTFMLLIAGVLLFSGCNRTKTVDVSKNGLTKIRVGYIGLTCEAPIFSAVEKGFFKEEGLDVSLVKCEWANYKDVLALGGFDIMHHLLMFFLKALELGLDLYVTGGI